MLSGFIISACLISSIFAWSNVSSIVFAEDHLENNFLISLSKPSPTYLVLMMKRTKYEYPIWDTYSLLKSEELVSAVEPVYITTCLFNTENKSDSYVWFPKPRNPILMGTVFIANNSFLKFIQDEMKLIEENLSIDDGVLISNRMVSQINETLGVSIQVGSKINFAIATKIPNFLERYNQLKFWKRVFFENLTVKGIYEWTSQDTLITTTLGTKKLAGNSLFMSSSLLNSTVRASFEEDILNSPGPPKLFVQIDPKEASSRGISNLKDEIEKLLIKIKASCEGEIVSISATEEIMRLISAYINSRFIILYILPVVILSILVTIYASEATFERKRNIGGILRARGFSSRQLYIIFTVESLSIALVGTILGFALGLLLGCWISAAKGVFQYDLASFQRFLNKVTVSPQEFLYSFISSATIPVFYTIGKARAFASGDIITTSSLENKLDKNRGLSYNVGFWKIEFKGIGIPYVLLMGMIISLAFIRWITSLLISRATVIFLYLIILAHWLLFAYFFGLVIIEILPYISRMLLKKPKGFLISIDLKSQKIFVPMLVLLISASSIMVFSLMTVESIQDNLVKEIRYAIGCDFRIYTSQEQPVSFARNLQGNSSFFSSVMPVLTSHSSIAMFYSIKIIGIDPMLYKNMSLWMPTSIINPSYEQALDALARNPNGTIISEYLSNALRLDLNGQVKIGGRNFVVVGIMRSTPGFGEAHPRYGSAKESLGFQETGDYVIVNQKALLENGINKTRLFFARSKKGASVEEIMEHLSNMTEVDSVYSPMTFDLSKRDIYKFMYLQGIYGSLSSQFIITILVSIVFLTFYLDYITSQRTVEYAVIRAVGATRKDIKVLILAKWIIIVLTALITGLIVGAIYSICLFDIIPYMFPFRGLVPYRALMPVFNVTAGFGVMMLAMTLIIYLFARRASSKDVTRALRNL